MTRRRMGFAVCWLLPVWPAVFGQPAAAPAPTAAEVNEQIRRLEPSHDMYERLGALAWMSQRLDSPRLDAVRPALERCLKDDPEPEVRTRALAALARLELRRKRPCPLSLIEALLCPTDVVRWKAGIWVVQFEEFAPGSVPVLLRGLRSDDADIRRNVLFPLARAARKDDKLLPAIRDRTGDKDWDVRDCAHLALYRATDQVDDFLEYLADERQAAHKAGPGDGEESAGQKRLREQRNMRMIGAAGLLGEWLASRPRDVARVLCRMLEDKSASRRAGAAFLLAEFANMNRFVKNNPRAFPSLEENTPREQEERSAQLARQMRELGVLDRLTRVAESDPDKDARQGAREALRCLGRQPPRP